ncbi:MAG: LD-carboxypeptidase [Bacteroidales bacterium]|nr:LD-carboxypeptidase [Bacteroidales bacterium]
MPVSLSCQAPSFLSPGDKVALLSPSYYLPESKVDSAAAVIRSWGYEPVIGPNVGKEYLGKYAGTPEERESDILWALHDPEIKAIICNRGGYGTIRFVDRLNLDELRRYPKWLVGFSDITTLHEMETMAGVMSVHGTMGSFLAKTGGTDRSSLLVKDILSGTIPHYEISAHPCDIPGKATGVLVGGNLCTFSPILGTEADATRGKDIILFIEEVEEDMSHIDRLINTLALNGVFNRCKGVVLGEFTDCGANLDFSSVEEMICSYLKDYNIPVCCGFPAGHDDVNLPLVMGSVVTLDVSESGSSLSFNVGGADKWVHVADALTVSDTTKTVAGDMEFPEKKQSEIVRAFNFARYYKGVRK